MKNTKTIISKALLALLIGVQLQAAPMAMAASFSEVTPADDTWCQKTYGSDCMKAFSDGKVTPQAIIDARSAPAPAPAPDPTPTPAPDPDTTATKPVDNTAPKPDVDPPAPTGPDTSVVTPEQEAKIINEASVTDTSTPEEEAARKAAAEAEAGCNAASKDAYAETMDCATYNARVESDREKKCAESGVYKNCAEKAAAMKSIQGAGFKLNLDALTLTSGGEKSGSAIFTNKDYAQYGVIVGTLLRITDILILLIGSLSMLTLVIAGIFMITNHGDEAWVTKGKSMMLYAILGMLVALLSFAIVNVIQSALA